MHMINIRRAFAGIGAGLLTLVTATTGSAHATTTHPHTVSPRVTVDLRDLPHGNCWYEISWLNKHHTAVNVEPLCAPTPPRHHHMASICTTGYRGQTAYDKHCLTTGTPHNAAHLWNAVPQGKHGHERDDYTTQRNICRHALQHGGITNAARELVGDMTYDTYRNNEQVNRWVGQNAALTCTQLGYRI